MRKWEPLEQPLWDLIEIIHFTEGVSAKIHGLLDKAEIYKTVRDEFAESNRYSATITLLTDDETSLRIMVTSLSSGKLKTAEKLAEIGKTGYRIDLNKSNIYSQVVREGKTIQASVGDILGELFRGPLVQLLLKALGYEKSFSILTPLKRYEKTIGVLGISSTTLVEHFVPSVRNLAQHISTALELAGEYTERKQAEEGQHLALAQVLQTTRALKESEERFRSLFERVPVGIYRTTPDGRILDSNPAQIQMLGHPDLESLLKTRTRDYYANESERKQWRVLMEKDGVVRNFEAQMHRRDGQLIWVRDRSRAVYDADGQVLYYEGSLEDITERKRAELSLDERVKELTCLYAVQQDMQEQLPLDELCWRIIEHLSVAMQSPGVAVPVIELHGIRFTPDRYTDALSHNLHTEIRARGEPCGQLMIYYTQPHSFLLPDEQNLLNAVAESLGLWLERQQAKESLRKSEQKMRAQYQSIPVPTYTWQRLWDDIVLVDYNDAAVAATGGAIADFIGTTAKKMYPDMPEIVAELSWCFTEKTTLEREMFYRLKTTGENKHLAVKYAFVPPDQVSVYTEDITERKRMEQYILRSERMAAMGHMAAIMAHEIQNPLQAIHSHLELVLDFCLEPGEREEYLRFCCQEIERLTKITAHTLDLARPAKDTLRPTSVAHLMQRALMLSKPLQHARVQITTDIPDKLPPVLVMPDQIVQILLNLITNAIEATTVDGGEVHIVARVDKDRVDQDMVVTTLTNDGPPIAPEHMEHIFTPFFTTKQDGTGLGLFISHNIIEQHGGMISVENLEDGKGVAFGVALPIARSTEEQEVTR